MKYIQMVHAFYERLEMIPLSVGAIALWHALMHMNHKQNGNKEFKAASAVLCFKSGLQENMLEETRQELLQKGFIRYEEMSDGQAATYILCPLGEESERAGEHIDHHAPEIDSEKSNHHESERRTEEIDHSELGVDQETNDDHASALRTSPMQSHESETVQGTFVTHHEQGIVAGSFGEQESDMDESTQKAALSTNTDCRLQAQLKKLEMHEKLLQKGWQQSVNMTLTDVEMNGELLSALQQYQSGDPVSIVIQTDRSRLAEKSPHPYTQTEGQSQQKKSDHDAVTEQPLTETRAVQLSKKTKTSPRSKTRAKGKRRQPKRGPESLNAVQEEEIISMGPFEDSPTDNTGKEKIIHEIIF